MAMWHYDCNPGEIMDQLSPKYGICYHCWSVVSDSEKNDNFYGFVVNVMKHDQKKEKKMN
jgi:hypothetical protein